MITKYFFGTKQKEALETLLENSDAFTGTMQSLAISDVTAAGSVTTGKTRPFGLDCSGFVTWVFINAGFSESYIGHGVGNQVAKGVRIAWDEAKPGDLAVYSDNSHIGIVAGRKDNGSLLVIHCNAGANNVVITDEEGFGYYVRAIG